MNEEQMRVIRGLKPLRRLRKTVVMEAEGEGDDAELAHDIAAFMAIKNCDYNGVNDSRIRFVESDSA